MAKRRVKAVGIAMIASKSFKSKGFKKASTAEIATAAKKWNEFEEKAAVRIQSECRRFLADKEFKDLKMSRDASDKWAAVAAAEAEAEQANGGGGDGAAAAEAEGTAI